MYMCVFVHMSMRAYMCVCMCACMDVCVCACMDVCVCLHMCMLDCGHVCVCTGADCPQTMLLQAHFPSLLPKWLMSWTENTNKLLTEQSRCRKHNSTNDKLFELTQAVSQAQPSSRCVGAMSGTMAYVMNCYT